MTEKLYIELELVCGPSDIQLMNLFSQVIRSDAMSLLTRESLPDKSAALKWMKAIIENHIEQTELEIKGVRYDQRPTKDRVE
jgi:hypothetical protein